MKCVNISLPLCRTVASFSSLFRVPTTTGPFHHSHSIIFSHSRRLFPEKTQHMMYSAPNSHQPGSRSSYRQLSWDKNKTKKDANKSQMSNFLTSWCQHPNLIIYSQTWWIKSTKNGHCVEKDLHLCASIFDSFSCYQNFKRISWHIYIHVDSVSGKEANVTHSL